MRTQQMIYSPFNPSSTEQNQKYDIELCNSVRRSWSIRIFENSSRSSVFTFSIFSRSLIFVHVMHSNHGIPKNNKKVNNANKYNPIFFFANQKSKPKCKFFRSVMLFTFYREQKKYSGRGLFAIPKQNFG